MKITTKNVRVYSSEGATIQEDSGKSWSVVSRDKRGQIVTAVRNLSSREEARQVRRKLNVTTNVRHFVARVAVRETIEILTD